jgi:chromosome segregation ATPase
MDTFTEYQRSEILKAAAELTRLATIEAEWAALSQDTGKAEGEIDRLRAELQQAREERTALLVNEQNLREELAALRASLGEPVGTLLVGLSFGGELGDYETQMNDVALEAINLREAEQGCEAVYTFFAIKDTK